MLASGEAPSRWGSWNKIKQKFPKAAVWSWTSEIVRDPRLHFCQRLICLQRQEADHVVGSQSIMGSSHLRGHRAGCLTITCWKLPPPNRHALSLPNPAPCLPAAHPFRAKLAQNFITILLRLISSSEAPSVGEGTRPLFSKCGSWAVAELEKLSINSEMGALLQTY